MESPTFRILETLSHSKSSTLMTKPTSTIPVYIVPTSRCCKVVSLLHRHLKIIRFQKKNRHIWHFCHESLIRPSRKTNSVRCLQKITTFSSSSWQRCGLAAALWFNFRQCAKFSTHNGSAGWMSIAPVAGRSPTHVCIGKSTKRRFVGIDLLTQGPCVLRWFLLRSNYEEFFFRVKVSRRPHTEGW